MPKNSIQYVNCEDWMEYRTGDSHLKKKRTGDCFYVCIKNLNRSYTIACSIKIIVIIHHICLEKKWIIHSAVGDSESENCIFLQCHINMMV